jgi:hypothetical protein
LIDHILNNQQPTPANRPTNIYSRLAGLETGFSDDEDEIRDSQIERFIQRGTPMHLQSPENQDNHRYEILQDT